MNVIVEQQSIDEAFIDVSKVVSSAVVEHQKKYEKQLLNDEMSLTTSTTTTITTTNDSFSLNVPELEHKTRLFWFGCEKNENQLINSTALFYHCNKEQFFVSKKKDEFSWNFFFLSFLV